MLKKIFIVLFILLAFLLASIYIFRTNIKRYAIQTILKSFPLPNVALANVKFDETTGKLNLEEIKIKNPKGFKNEYMIEADSVNMDISFTTKPNLRLNINEIDITNPVFYVERSPDDKWNFLEYPKKQATYSAKAPSSGEVPSFASYLSSLAKENDSENSLKGGSFNFIKEVFAAESEGKPQVLLPKTININNGAIHIMDNFVAIGKTHKVDLFPVTGTLSLYYEPEKQTYTKINFSGSSNMAGAPERMIKGNFEIYPTEKNPSYALGCNAYNVPLSTIKPYLDRYTPFIVTQGSFNMASQVKSVNGSIDGDYTMELMDLVFALNPEKSNVPFLETSVKKLTLYLTNQSGNVVIDFKQKGVAGGKIRWELGPIAKRAIGLMAIDTVIEVIDTIQKSGEGSQMVPNDIPPEVIDIFRGIFK
jgi:hypothetical protein